MTTAERNLFDQSEAEPPRTASDPPPARPNARRLRDRIFQFIRQQGPKGATDGEIQEALSLSGDSERPRRGELVDAGEIVFSGRTRPTRSGEPAKVWILAEHADAPEPPPETPSAPRPAAKPPSRPSPDRKIKSRRLADERENRLGAKLDAMPTQDLETLCRQTLPGWPRIFGKEHTPETARRDSVCRRLLLKAIDETSPSTI